MSRPLTYDDLYAIASPSDPQLSPDGSQVVYVVTRPDRDTDGYVSTLWLAHVASGALRQLTYGPADSSPRWSPDGSTLAFLRSVDKQPAQVWLLPVTGGEARQLTSREGGAGAPVWAPDGARLAFAALVDLDPTPAEDQRTKPLVVETLDGKLDGVGLLRGRRQHLFVVAAGGGEPRQLTEGDLSVSQPVWSSDGSRLAYSGAAHLDRDLHPGSAVFVVGLDGGAPRQLTSDKAFLTVADWQPGELLLHGMGEFRVGHTRLFVLPETGGEPTELVPGLDRNVMPGSSAYPGALPRYDGDRVVFCVRDRGATQVVATSGAGLETLVGGEQVVSGLSTRNGRIAYVAGTPELPGELYVDGRRLTDLFRTALPDVALVAPRPREFTAPDGTLVHGWVLRGEVEGATPLLLDVHGGPHNAWGPAADVVHLYHQVLVGQGWTVAYVNPRGSDGYGESFYRAVSTEWGLSDEGDFLSAVDALVAEGTADPRRLAVTGYSYGGFMTCWLTARTDRFAAAVTGGCVSNLLSQAGTSDYGRFLALHEGGALVHEDAQRLLERSPISYVKGVVAPTLVLHGEDDDRCPVGQAEEWFAALRNQGVPTALVRYPGGSHLFVVNGRPSHRIDYCRRVADWVSRYAS